MHVAIAHSNPHTLFISASNAQALSAAQAHSTRNNDAFSEALHAHCAFVAINNNDEELTITRSANSLQALYAQMLQDEWLYATCSNCNDELYSCFTTATITCGACGATNTLKSALAQVRSTITSSYCNGDSERAITVVNMLHKRKVRGTQSVVFV